MKKKYFYFIFSFSFFLYLYPLHSATHITADRSYVKYGTQVFLFDGNVLMDSPNLSINANQLEYAHKNITASGNLNLKLKQEDINITAQGLTRSGKNTRLYNKDGFVVMNDVKNQRDIKSEVVLIEDQGNKKNMITFQGEAELNEKVMRATAEKNIVYNQLKKTTFFMGNSKIEDKEKKSTIRSKDIQFLEEKQKLVFLNPVSISDAQNHFLSGSTGDYDIQTKYLNMDTNVQYIGDVARIYSDRLRTDQILDKEMKNKRLVYYFEKNIKLTYQSFTGTSRQILVDPEKNYTELIDNVYLKGNDNGLIVLCDIMDIMEKEKKSYLYNNVRLIDGKRLFTSDIATYDDRTKIFTLRGNATYTNDGSIYNAQTIYLNSNDLSIKFVGQVKGSSTLDGLKGIKVDNE